MRYFVSAADDRRAAALADGLREAGVHVVDEYDGEAVVVSVGGDGAILYNARQYGQPTVLPVRLGGSEGNRIQVDAGEAVDRIAALVSEDADRDYRVVRHHKLAVTVDGEPLRDGFRALNDVHLHHASPVRSAKFAVAVEDVTAGERRSAGSTVDGDAGTGVDWERVTAGDREVVYATDNAIGDGLLVATPFGSTAYYRSITGGDTFESGLGVAFNNGHKPVDAPESLVCSPEAVVRMSLNETSHGENAVLARDDDPDTYRPSVGETVEVRRSDVAVDVIRFVD